MPTPPRSRFVTVAALFVRRLLKHVLRLWHHFLGAGSQSSEQTMAGWPDHSVADSLDASMSYDDGLAVLKKHTGRLRTHDSGVFSRRAQESGDNVELAEKFLRWAIAVGELIPDQTASALCSHDLADFLISVGRPHEAIVLLRKVLPHYRQQANMEEVGTVYAKLVRCHIKAGEPREAMAAIREVNEILSKAGQAHRSTINFYPELAALLEQHDEHDEAGRIRHAIEVSQRLLECLEEPRSKYEDAQRLSECGRVAEAATILDAIQDTFLTNTDVSDQASFFLLKGGVLSSLGKFSQAEAILSKAISVFHEIGNLSGEAKSRKTLASKHEDQGQYQLAIEGYRTALMLFEQAGDRAGYGRTLTDLGVLHKNLNLHLDAARYYLTARAYLREARATEDLRGVVENMDVLFTKLSIRLSRALAEEIRTLLEAGDFIEAAQRIEQAESPWEVGSDPTQPLPPLDMAFQLQGGALRLMADARSYLDKGRIDDGVRELSAAALTMMELGGDGCRKAVHVFDEIFSLCDAHGLVYDRILAMRHRANCHVRLGQLESARHLLVETIRAAADRDLFPIMWQSRFTLSTVCSALGEHRRALKESATVCSQIEQRARTLKHLRKVEGFLADKTAVYQQYVDQLVGAGKVRAAYHIVLRAKSWPLANLLDRVRASAAPLYSDRHREVLKLKEAEIQRLVENEQMHSLGAGGGWRNWLLECEEIKLAEEASEERWGCCSRGDQGRMSPASIQQRLRSGDVILDFFFTQRNLHVFVVRADGLNHIPVPYGQDELMSWAAQAGYFDLIRGSTEFRERAVENVREMVLSRLGPYVSPLLADAQPTQVCLIPSGVLHLLPLVCAMPEVSDVRTGASSDVAETGQFVSYVPHASRFRNSRGPAGKRDMRYVGVGNPDGTLHHARDEVLKASKYFDRSTSFVAHDRAVDANELLNRLNGADVIHFACHAVLRADIYELSYLLIDPSKPLRTIDILSRGHTSAKLVLLSACSTSVGRVTPSDEITSLARAFLYIGAEAVLATLWPIPDETTNRFIQEFFRQWVTLAKPRREAFDGARHALRAQPRVALAFILIEA